MGLIELFKNLKKLNFVMAELSNFREQFIDIKKRLQTYHQIFDETLDALTAIKAQLLMLTEKLEKRQGDK